MLISGAVNTYLYLCESYWFNNLGIFTEGNYRYAASQTFHLGKPTRGEKSSMINTKVDDRQHAPNNLTNYYMI